MIDMQVTMAGLNGKTEIPRLVAMSSNPNSTPIRAWVVTFAGTALNLCLGILYAWSVWKANLVAKPGHPAGSAISGLD